MGKGISKLLSKMKSGKPLRILLLGLDSAGKSTILYMMKVGEFVPTVPTVGFNVESLVYKNVRFDCWDATGQEKFRHLWKNYFTNDTKGFIYVVDSSDNDRISEAKEELWRIISENYAKKAALLILCNKQDGPKAMTVAEISEQLKIKEITQPCHIQGCVGIFCTFWLLTGGYKWRWTRGWL